MAQRGTDNWLLSINRLCVCVAIKCLLVGEGSAARGKAQKIKAQSFSGIIYDVTVAEQVFTSFT